LKDTQRSKWPRTRADLRKLIERHSKFPYKLNDKKIVPFLAIEKILTLPNFSIDKERIVKISFDSVPTTLAKMERTDEVDEIKVLGMKKVIAWLKNHPEQITENEEQNPQKNAEIVRKIVEQLVNASEVMITVEPDAVLEELESRGDIIVSKKDESTINYDIDHLIGKQRGFCSAMLWGILMLLFFSALLGSIFGHF